jgi:hypothetical protein
MLSVSVTMAVLMGAGAGLGLGRARAAEPVQLPELIELLQNNLAGATSAELNKLAVAGLLERLAPRVTLVEDGSGKAASSTNGPALTSAIFERSYGYLRFSRFSPEAGQEFQGALATLMSSNKLRGLVVDLRFTRGGDYSGAVAIADQFFSDARDLVNWGEGMRKSAAKSNAVTLPTAVLINRETAGAAEVLAGILRHGEAALLVGTNTAGQAGATKDFNLKTGQRVRVAVAPVKVLDDRELPFTGIRPDIEVMVETEEERLYLADAFRVVKNPGATVTPGEVVGTSTNRNPRRRINEAELVRMTREGQDPRDPAVSTPQTIKAAEALGPVVTDPVLARALDVLKGLAVVQRFRGL